MNCPKDPPVLKMLQREFSTETQFTTAIAKRYREVSDMLVFLEKLAANRYKKRKATAVAKWEGFRLRSIFSTEGSFGW